MTIPVTGALAALCLALAVFCGWRGARTSRPHAPPRMIPWRFLMLLAFTGMIAFLVHLVNLIRDPAGVGT